MMSNFTLTFTVAAGQATSLPRHTPHDAVELIYTDRLCLRFYYDFRPEPLVLTADCKLGDNVRAEVSDAVIRLYVNSELCDEEWPCGKLCCDVDGFTGDFAVTFGTDAGTSNDLRCRKGISADMLRLPGVNIGDCMPYSDIDTVDITDLGAIQTLDKIQTSDGRYHLFWLYDRHHHRSKWGLGAHQWAHCSTRDFVTWDEHPMAIAITSPDEGSICTGSVTRTEDGWSAWYAVRMSDGSPARLTRATSGDNEHYTKSGEYFVLPERYHRPSARDPKVFCVDGKYHMLVTTSLLVRPDDTDHNAANRETASVGCLAHLVSDSSDMHGFRDLGALILTGKNQPECPDWFRIGDYYYLVWSICGTAYYAWSEKPFGDGSLDISATDGIPPRHNDSTAERLNGWSLSPDGIDCGRVPKSAVLPATGERIFTGFVAENGYAGDVVFAVARQNPDGSLSFERI